MSYYDLSGILAVQQVGLDRINALGSSISQTTELTNLQNNLNAIYTQFNSANLSSLATLTQQAQVQSIVNEEEERIKRKR